MYRQLAGRLLIAALTVLLPLVTLVTPASAALVCADLVVTGLSVNPPSPIAGQSVQVNVTVKNQGTCDVTTGFVVQWQSSSFGGDTLGGTLTELDAGQSQTLTFPYIFTKAGNFLTTATVDSGKAVPETIESNNSRLLSVTVQAATTDLIVSSIVFTPNPAVATDPTHVAITLQNTGNTDAGPFTAQWVSQPNAKAITQQYPGLAAGASILWEFDYTYTRAGSFDTVATVDTGNDVKETNENNNSLTVPLTVDPPLADLIVTNVSINPTNPIAGQPAVVTVTVQNVGHRATDVTNPGDFVVQWKPAPTEQPLTQQVNGPLAVGATATVTFPYTYLAGGTFNSTATVDATFKVQEVHEDNNTKTLQVPVANATIDLEVTDFTVSPASPNQGEDTTFSVTVRNNGNTEADNFYIQVNPDTTGITSPSPHSVTLFVTSLAAGATVTYAMPAFQYPGTGNVRAVATVDATGTVSETNEANNTKLLFLTVNPGVIDLQVTGFSLATDLCAQSLPPSCSPMKFWKGSAVTATITVQNFGSFPAGNFAVQWRPDSTKTTGPSVQVPGLAAFGHPGDTITVTVTGSFSADGAFTTSAFVDPNNLVIEPCPNCENNNESSLLNVTVLPRDLSLNVTVTDFHVFNDLDDGIRGSGEWNMWLLVMEKNATCHISFSKLDKDIKGFTCPFHYFSPDGDTDYPNPGWSASVTLAENAPLVFGIFGLEDDLPTGVDKPGAAFKFFLPGDFNAGGTYDLPGQKGDGRCSNGECFDATIQVTITAGPPPPAKVGAVVPAAGMFDALRQANDAANSLNQVAP